MMDATPETRRSLIVKLRDREDVEAWSEFVEIYEPLIYGMARKKGLQDADARDLVQEVLRAVSRSVERWDPALGGFRPWLSRIARNLIINALTRRREPRGSGATSVQARLEDEPVDDPSATALVEAEYRRRLFQWAAERERGACREETWQAFWRTAVEGRAAVEVATELGMTVGAVYVARSRVLARIKRHIERVSGERALHGEGDHEDAIGSV